MHQEVENTNHINAITIKNQNSADFLPTTPQTAAIVPQTVTEKGRATVLVCAGAQRLCANWMRDHRGMIQGVASGGE